MNLSMAPGGENRVVLRNVSWRTYECLLEDYENQSGPRFTYDRGILEIMSPLFSHEKANRSLQVIVDTICEEWGIDIVSAGSTTFKREDIDRGFEPDSSFYIQNAEVVADRDEIDLLGGDPPPDLVIEVDLTSSSIPKFPIFAAFGVPEVWRYVGQQATILALSHGSYEERDESLTLPRLTSTALNDFMNQSRTLRRVAWLRMIREWVRRNID
jgi:Uma2 family endonuclease